MQTNGASDRADLRRSILDSALKSQQTLRSSQQELARQGDLLDRSLQGGRRISGQTESTRQRVDELVEETKVGKWTQLLRCCCPCLNSACCTCCRSSRADRRASQPDGGGARPTKDNESLDEHQELQATFDRLKGLLAEARKRPTSQHTVVSWRRTLGPSLYESSAESAKPTGAATKKSSATNQHQYHYDKERAELWHRQMDASLAQLQLTAEEMETTFEQQTRLANLLAAYLNHGAEQVLEANKRLVDEQQRFR
jgi:hypothetical protein